LRKRAPTTPFISRRDGRRAVQVGQGRACGPPRRGRAARGPWRTWTVRHAGLH